MTFNLIVVEYGGERYDWEVEAFTINYDSDFNMISSIKCQVKKNEDEK
jgi:hypothetical protein